MSTSIVPTPQWLAMTLLLSHLSISIVLTPQWLAFTQPLSHTNLSEPLLLLSPLSGLL